ncbi:MAG: hypothetical protein A2Y64_06570 [Candidatus Coatesbacteria bacterium RBG_13_66_14]|uniref:Bacterial Pleckstrin homology domain-containing protein n=1 Tax=Candidatus Coatesbacteria bacterium RBG_13_66_14 TaxID=1817816 RepID=A0A1F5FG24_9BACT|nr:MAG: hypothetical protein A2Y64_06570 [Candidatus Coatesbacteria bacterium RBG_13_66_14]
MVLYRERLTDWISQIIFWIVLALCVFLGLFPKLLGLGAEIERIFPWVFLPAAGLVFLLILNFLCISIRLDDEGLSARLGVFRTRARWDQVSGAEPDTLPGSAYGGWGVKGGHIGAEYVQVYSTVAHRRVAVKLSGHKLDKLIFSTKSPEEVIRVINEHRSLG